MHVSTIFRSEASWIGLLCWRAASRLSLGWSASSVCSPRRSSCKYLLAAGIGQLVGNANLQDILSSACPNRHDWGSLAKPQCCPDIPRPCCAGRCCSCTATL